MTTIQPTLELDPETLNRRAEISARLGLAPDRIRSVQLQLDVLRKQGILVDLTISGVSMFTRAATWMELGILDEDVRRARFSRGQKYLIPEEPIKRLRSVESQMRQLLENLSYRVAGFYPYRWIPFTAYEKFKSEWAVLQERFNQVKLDILDDYDAYIDLLASDFDHVARSAWRSIQAADQRPAVIFIDGAEYADLDAFTDAIISRALARFPSRARVETDLYADYATALVYGEQDLAADELAASRLHQQIQIERAHTDAQKREAYLQADLLEHEVQHQASLNRFEEAERQIKIEAMRQAESEHARQRLQQMGSPFEEIFVALRQQIAADCQAMLDSIQKNGYVRGKIAEKGRGLIELYQLMAAHDDHELRDKLIQLKRAIGPVGDQRPEDAPDRDAAAISSILHQISGLAHTAAQDLLAGPSRFSLVEV